MYMTFWWDSRIDNFLFYGFNIKTIPVLLLTCSGVAGLAFLFEWIKLLQAQHKQCELVIRAKQLRTICPMMENTSLIPKNIDKPLDLSFRNRVKLYTFDAAIWFSLHNLGYLIMLMVMLYNLWLFIAVLFGGGLGYFIFGQRFMKINLENCSVIRDTYCMARCGNPEGQKDGESTPTMVQASSSLNACHNTHSTNGAHVTSHQVHAEINIYADNNDC